MKREPDCVTLTPEEWNACKTVLNATVNEKCMSLTQLCRAMPIVLYLLDDEFLTTES